MSNPLSNAPVGEPPASPPTSVLALVERFERNRAAYEATEYKELELREEFLNPLMAALGWDVNNIRGYAETYKEVVHEPALTVHGAPRAPDYSFRIGGARKFFVEAKKPSVNIKNEPGAAFQLRRYAWSADLPLGVLTNFKEWAVYDCRARPRENESAANSRILYLKCTEYATRWNELVSLFSRDAVLKGDFDRFASSSENRRGSNRVDVEFLREIERWRELLAKSIALLNPALTDTEINSAVQVTIDRIVFLRICEDRGIEKYETLKDIAGRSGIYHKLLDLFRSADNRYNSGLFHFKAEPKRPAPDRLTPNLIIDDEPLEDILTNLYFPASPYEFAVIPAEILGKVYERFLGNVIRLTPGHRAVIDQKPEVRKAGGVYYTPTYVVDYIVQNTVGRLVEASDPESASSIRVLDPACGSGSFLLGAYRFLLDWHLRWYVANRDRFKRKYRDRIYEGIGAQWLLTSAEKKRILRNNIFGVDIDPQAVEVTKLSLLLKVLENENNETIEAQLRLLSERALPDLSDNIKSGNSLISTDYGQAQEELFLNDAENERVNAFNWELEFPMIFGRGPSSGFDVVIGNPPYLSYSGRQAVDLSDSEREYLFSEYRSTRWPTAHSFFLERAVTTLSRRIVGFIVPDQVGHLAGYEPLRKILQEEAGVVEVRYWGEKVFEDAITPALTVILDKDFRGKTAIVEQNASRWVGHLAEPLWKGPGPKTLLARLRRNTETLGTLVRDPGVHTGNCSAKLIIPLDDAEPGDVPVLEGKQISRYSCQTPQRMLRLGYNAKRDEYFTIRPKEKYERAEFLIRQTAAYPIVGPRKHAVYFRNSLLALYPPLDQRDIRYLVGILNSKLMRFVYMHTVAESHQKAFPQVKIAALRSLPVRTVNLADRADRNQHDSIVAAVKDTLAAYEATSLVRAPHAEVIANRKIRTLENHINDLVYQLYDLSSAEIDIIEEFCEDTPVLSEAV